MVHDHRLRLRGLPDRAVPDLGRPVPRSHRVRLRQDPLGDRAGPLAVPDSLRLSDRPGPRHGGAVDARPAGDQAGHRRVHPAGGRQVPGRAHRRCEGSVRLGSDHRSRVRATQGHGAGTDIRWTGGHAGPVGEVLHGIARTGDPVPRCSKQATSRPRTERHEVVPGGAFRMGSEDFCPEDITGNVRERTTVPTPTPAGPRGRITPLRTDCRRYRPAARQGESTERSTCLIGFPCLIALYCIVRGR
ncbi:hypothetical protein RHRU231_40054 [Rhodococcus ruber]|uniref:Sulfatase-modifying factor enzyme domain-containing protein n=1 Tax=Rhodococcus ruber TaxID=1830 RepID=A0A098BHV2_9NOCA|nr:hypothetical protein RHRU231_40054 [Rhodococcus ruber]